MRGRIVVGALGLDNHALFSAHLVADPVGVCEAARLQVGLGQCLTPWCSEPPAHSRGRSTAASSVEGVLAPSPPLHCEEGAPTSDLGRMLSRWLRYLL